MIGYWSPHHPATAANAPAQESQSGTRLGITAMAGAVMNFGFPTCSACGIP
jgi:hypothetical protein